MMHKIIHRINSVDLDDDLTITRMILVIVSIATFIAFLLSFCTEDNDVRSYIRQTDKEFADMTFNGDSVASSGCGIFSLYFCADRIGEPVSIEDLIFLYEKAYPDQSVGGMNPCFMTSIDEYLGLEIHKEINPSEETIDGWLDDGGLIIIVIPKNTKDYTEDYKHYCVIYSYNSKNYDMYNPATKKINSNRISYDVVKTCEIYFVNKKKGE